MGQPVPTLPTVNMISSALVLASLVSVAVGGVIVAPHVVRVPSQDSAIIQSHRLGGNFAYSVAEAHAFGVQTPIVEQRVVPTGVTFHQGIPQIQTHTSVVKQRVSQFGVVKTQHTVPLGYSGLHHGVVGLAGSHVISGSPVVQIVKAEEPKE